MAAPGTIFQVLPQPPPIKVVDVGAMSLGGDDEPYSGLLKKGLATVIGFEPVAAECDKLNAEAGSGSGRVYLPYAVGDGRRRTFHICNYPMTSSLYEPDTALLKRFVNLENLVQVVDRQEVDTRRLDDLAEVADADFLKLDVQGAEVDVFNGAPRVLDEAVIIHTEVEFVALYKDQPLFAEVDQRLRKAGYRFHKFVGMSGRAFQPLVVRNNPNQVLSQLLWANALYVKDFMALDKLPPDKLLKLATILDASYGSIDLALQALAAYDVKMGTDLGTTYLRLLTSTPPASPTTPPAAQ